MPAVPQWKSRNPVSQLPTYVEQPELDPTRVPPVRAAIHGALQGLLHRFAELNDGEWVRMNKSAVDEIVL